MIFIKIVLAISAVESTHLKAHTHTHTQTTLVHTNIFSHFKRPNIMRETRNMKPKY